MRTNNLVVLEYSTNTVHFHKVADSIEDMDKAIIALGYNPDDVYYMCGDIEVIKHKGILTSID